jgi:hypothetical protein
VPAIVGTRAAMTTVMKKQHRPKLHVNVETVRALTDVRLEQLEQVCGGRYKTTLMAVSACLCTTSNENC